LALAVAMSFYVLAVADWGITCRGIACGQADLGGFWLALRELGVESMRLRPHSSDALRPHSSDVEIIRLMHEIQGSHKEIEGSSRHFSCDYLQLVRACSRMRASSHSAVCVRALIRQSNESTAYALRRWLVGALASSASLEQCLPGRLVSTTCPPVSCAISLWTCRHVSWRCLLDMSL